MSVCVYTGSAIRKKSPGLITRGESEPSENERGVVYRLPESLNSRMAWSASAAIKPIAAAPAIQMTGQSHFIAARPATRR